MTDPCTGRRIREKDYLHLQGRLAAEYNVLQMMMNSVVGLFRSNKSYPLAVARDRKEQKMSELLSVIMEYVYDTVGVYEIDAKSFSECWYSGLSIHQVGYKYDKERKMSDIFVKKINQNMFFTNSDFSDTGDLKIVGVIHDLDLEDVLSQFWKGDEAFEEKIRNIYGDCSKEQYIANLYRTFSRDKIEGINFMMPEIGKARVVEVWSYESRKILNTTDYTSENPKKIFPYDMLPKIEAENEKRKEEAKEQGVSEEDVLLIEIEADIEQYVMVRYFAPNGFLLEEKESPYTHGLIPFVLQANTDDDGEIHSPAEMQLKIQRQINRLMSQVDFAINTSVRETLYIPDEMIENSSMTAEEIRAERQKTNGVITGKALKYDEQTKQYVPIPMPTVLRGQDNGAAKLSLEIAQFNFEKAQKLAGINEALQGQTPNAGTPGYRYAQESQNAANNLRDFLDRFNEFRKKRDYLILKTIQQYYSKERYVEIAGDEYINEANNIDLGLVSETNFDIKISESGTSITYRAMMDDLMTSLSANPMSYQDGLTPRVILRNSSHPKGDRVADEMEKEKKRMQEEATAIAQQQAQMQAAQQGMIQKQINEQPQQIAEQPQISNNSVEALNRYMQT